MMLEEVADKFCMLKRAFYASYKGSAHIQEIIPRDTFEGVDTADIHRLAGANPIYDNTYDTAIQGVQCTIYEGDISQYCIDSMKNTGSAQPFYPTWFFTAYMLALAVKKSGCSQIIDVGSGDGRIALCGRVLGMDVCSIELDNALAELQEGISGKAGMHLDVRCADAASFDYAALGFDSPAVFTGGLPQMGDILADAVIRAMPRTRDTRFILAGTYRRPGLGGPADLYGWRTLVDRWRLSFAWIMNLPTVWTFDQSTETPYICASL